MATETQKNFRKQMKELDEERKGMASPRVYSYIERDFVNNQTYFTRRRIISFSGIITFLALLFYAFPSIMGIMNAFTADKQKPVIGYLEKMKIYDNQLKAIMDSVNNNLKNLKMTSPDSRNQFVNSMKNNLTAVESIQSEIKVLKAPEGLEVHKAATVSVYQSLHDGINQYIQGVAGNNQENLNNAQNSMNQYSLDINKKKIALMSAFDKFDIKYQVMEDGTIHYSFKTVGRVP